MPESSIVDWAYWTAQTKRNPAKSGGKIGAAVVNLQSISLTPVMPTPIEVIERYPISSPVQSFVTYADGVVDILEGDDIEFLYSQNVNVPDFGTSDRFFSVNAVGRWDDKNGHGLTEIVVLETQGS